MKLTQKEQEFLLAYLKNGFNAQAAHREVFPNGKISSYAYKILKRPHVKVALKEMVEELSGDQEVLAMRSLLKLQEIAFAEKSDEYYNATAQLKALDLIGKQLGLQIQNIKADVKGQTEIVINITGDEDEDED